MENKIFSGDSFFTAAGNVDTMSTEPLSVVFLGGSLTSGDIDYEGTSLTDWNMKWPNTVLRFLNGLFPSREITAHNAGLGGTGSQYGAMRFAKDVLAYSPDLIFIEFSVNDMPNIHHERSVNREGCLWRQKFLENIIRQAMNCEKVPAIVYVHLPVPALIGSERNLAHRLSCEFKEDMLRYYDIGTIDVYDVILNEFECRKKMDSSLTLQEFLKQYYHMYDSGVFDVHPHAWGYKLFNLAVVNALMKEPQKYLRPFKMRKDIYCKGEDEIVNRTFNYIKCGDERIKYTGDWKIYTAENKLVTDNSFLAIPDGKYTNNNDFPDGIAQVYMPKDEASFEFDTEADAVCFPHVSSKLGLGSTIYADGEKVGEFTCFSNYQGMNYSGDEIKLPKGKKHVKVKINNPTETATVFRYGYVVEIFDK
ncbi:MAG: SGNH/GDSL hydrolase family protein [Eubacteriales bacterium]|nr:SGNH/GDSL hydrolase family protein [Eubacteriales bacterium]